MTDDDLVKFAAEKVGGAYTGIDCVLLVDRNHTRAFTLDSWELFGD